MKTEILKMTPAVGRELDKVKFPEGGAIFGQAHKLDNKWVMRYATFSKEEGEVIRCVMESIDKTRQPKKVITFRGLKIVK